MSNHLHYIEHRHEVGHGIRTTFTCKGDRTSPCHQYPPFDLGMEVWSDEDKHLFVSHDKCWIEVAMNDYGCIELCGPDGELVRGLAPVAVTFDECIEWKYIKEQTND